MSRIESDNVKDLCAASAEYRQSIAKLYEDTKDNPGARELKRRGYGYLVTKFYDIAKHAQTTNMPSAPEFQNLIFFVRYIGPRPTEKHSLDRINYKQGYVIGNVRWADKKTQSSNRRTSRLHKYLGRRMTDAELVAILNREGWTEITTAAIKKQRQRLQRSGCSSERITEEIFRSRGIPYELTGDCVEDWDFKDEDFHPKILKQLLAAYPYFRKANETRIAFAIRWMKKEEARIRSIMYDPYADMPVNPDDEDLMGLYILYFKAADHLMGIEYDLRHKRARKVISDTPPPFWKQVCY